MEAFPAHNTVAYIAYHGGLIAAVLYVAIIARFLLEGFKRVHRIDVSTDFLSRPEIVGVFAFIVGIIAVSLVGGPLLDYRLSWFFWFLTAALIKRWNCVLDNQEKKGDH
jgi:O-antigen ligase